MMTAAPDLPDDIEALKALVVAMAEKAGRLEDRNAAVEAENVRIRAENAELAALNRNADERIARLMLIIAMFERARYGKRLEKLRVDALSEEQYQFVFDGIDTGLAAISAELERIGGKARPMCAPRPRKAFRVGYLRDGCSFIRLAQNECDLCLRELRLLHGTLLLPSSGS